MSRVTKITTRNDTADSQGIPENVKKLREQKGLGEINTLNLTSDLQSDVDSLSTEEINELWSEYEASLKEM